MLKTAHGFRHVLSLALLGLISALLAGCGGGGSSSGGAFSSGSSAGVSIRTADGSNQVDWNPTLAPPDARLGFTKTLIVEVRDKNTGTPAQAEELEVRLQGTQGIGALCVPVASPPPSVADRLDTAVGPCPNDLAGPFSRVVYGNRSSVELFFVAANVAGAVDVLVHARNVQFDEADVRAADRQATASIRLNVVGDTGPAASMSFTGPFVEAIRAGRFETAIAPGEAIFNDGSYQRVVSVVTTDADGNPPRVGTPVDFFLIDGPLAGFPLNPGSFVVGGNDGDPIEGGFQFFAGSGQFINRGVLSGDRLVLDGQNFGINPNNRALTGIRTVTDVVNQISLNIDPAGHPFNINPVGNTGPSVPYAVGRAERGTILSRATTNDTGVASTLLTYPFTSVGRTAILVACSPDRLVCTVLNPCSSGGANCAPVYLPVIADTFTISPTELGPNRDTAVTMCLRDPNRVPSAFAPIGYSIGAAGGATVTVNGNPASSGFFTTGADGCATVIVSSSGQLPGSDDIILEFDPGQDLATQQVTIKAPGDAEILATSTSCRNTDDDSSKICIEPEDTVGSYDCQVELLVRTLDGLPLSDAVVSHTSDNPLADISYNPAFGSLGITGIDGFVIATVVPDPANQPIVTFEAAGVEKEVNLNLPSCSPPVEPVEPSVVNLVGSAADLAPGSVTNLAVVLDEPAPQEIEVNVLATGDTGAFTVEPKVTVLQGASSAPLEVAAKGDAAPGSSIQLQLTSGVGYALGATVGPLTFTVTTEAVQLPTVNFIGEDATLARDGVASLAVVLDSPAVGKVLVNVLSTGDTGHFDVPTTVEIEDGASSAPLPITANADALDGRTIQVRLTSGTGYTLADAGPLTFTVNDALSALPTAILSNPGSSTSGLVTDETVTLSVTLDPPALNPVVVRVLTTGTNVGRFEVPDSVTVPAGESTQEFDVVVQAGTNDGEVQIQLTSGLGYVLEGFTSNVIELQANADDD